MRYSRRMGACVFPNREAIKTPDWDPVERAEQILQALRAEIFHAEGDHVFYRPSTGSIHLPYKHQILVPDRYYATALHELGHLSGQESRLNRDLSHPFVVLAVPSKSCKG